MSRIPLHDVHQQNGSIRTELDGCIADVLNRGQFVSGIAVAQFEDAFSQYIGTTDCVGVGNATDGFEIAFRALGLDAGAEIIIPTNAHVSPALAALHAGLKPVFADVDPNRMLIDADTILERITDKTKAVVAVHLYGRVCPMDEILGLCQSHGLILIEDFSQAHGASYKGKKVGSFGKISVCSFYPTKPLGALGDGGAIVTSDSSLAVKCRALANYGWQKRDNASLSGSNSRLDELQAAFLLLKLKYLDKWNAERLQQAKALYLKLEDLPDCSPTEFIDGDVCHLFTVRTDERDALKTFLESHQVKTSVHYPIPIHQQEIFHQKDHLKVSEHIAQRILSIPVHTDLAEYLRIFFS